MRLRADSIVAETSSAPTADDTDPRGGTKPELGAAFGTMTGAIAGFGVTAVGTVVSMVAARKGVAGAPLDPPMRIRFAVRFDPLSCGDGCFATDSFAGA